MAQMNFVIEALQFFTWPTELPKLSGPNRGWLHNTSIPTLLIATILVHAALVGRTSHDHLPIPTSKSRPTNEVSWTRGLQSESGHRCARSKRKGNSNGSSTKIYGYASNPPLHYKFHLQSVTGTSCPFLDHLYHSRMEQSLICAFHYSKSSPLLMARPISHQTFIACLMIDKLQKQ